MTGLDFTSSTALDGLLLERSDLVEDHITMKTGSISLILLGENSPRYRLDPSYEMMPLRYQICLFRFFPVDDNRIEPIIWARPGGVARIVYTNISIQYQATVYRYLRT